MIQDIVLIPYRVKAVADDIMDVREEASKILIVLFSFPQVA